ncbi:hypothetical protein [Phormidium nigroviride]
MIIKALSSTLAVAFLATATGLLTQATVASKDVQRRDLPSLQAQANQNKEPLKVALPTLAQVMLKGGNPPISGKVTEIDSLGQKLLIERNSQKLSLPLSKVEKVVFKNGNVFYRTDGRQVFRGDGGTVSPAGEQRTLPNIPMNAFTLEDANKGLAEVTLGPGGISRGIRDTAKNRQFVVDEMQFNLPKKTMMIKATPYSLM